eukprot:IDg1991t1
MSTGGQTANAAVTVFQPISHPYCAASNLP